MMGLRIYGENAFTFRFFEDALKNGGIRTLLANLKCFEQPRNKFDVTSISPDAAPEIWLFPSLGKRTGFGEPDAIVTIDQHAFWFEIETDLDLRCAEQPFRQLARFHYAAQALQKGPSRHENALVYAGPTITDRDEKKAARLRLRGHKASPLLRMLRAVSAHHYVVYPIHKPRGAGDWRKNLPIQASLLFQRWDAIVGLDQSNGQFPLHRAWYVYWEGDLKRFAGGVDPMADCVSIKRA